MLEADSPLAPFEKRFPEVLLVILADVSRELKCGVKCACCSGAEKQQAMPGCSGAEILQD